MKRAIVVGSVWMVGMRWSIRLLGVVSTVVLARLLAPGDFGLVAMAMVIAGFVEILFEFGVNLALIQNDRATKDHFDSAWTLRILQAVLAATLMLACASAAADYYDDPRVQDILMVVALSTLVQGFSNIGVVAFSKELQFGWEYAFRVAAKVLSVGVTIGLAIVLENYWALVFGALAASVLQVFLSYVIHPFRPRLSLKAARDIWSFSQWSLVVQLANYMSWKFDRFLIGGVASPSQLGLYTVGGEIAEMPSAEIVAPLSRSLVPGFAKLKRHADRLRNAFLISMNAAVTVGLPAGIGMFMVSPLLIPIVLGDKWVEAVSVVQLLALYGVTRVFFSTASNLARVTGRIRALAGISVVRSLVFLSSIYWAFNWGGIEGVALMKLLTGVLNAIAVNALIVTTGVAGTKAVLNQCWRPAIASLVMAAVVTMLDGPLAAFPSLIHLMALVLVGAVSYLIVLLGLWFAARCPDGIERAVWRYIADKYPPYLQKVRR